MILINLLLHYFSNYYFTKLYDSNFSNKPYKYLLIDSFLYLAKFILLQLIFSFFLKLAPLFMLSYLFITTHFVFSIIYASLLKFKLVKAQSVSFFTIREIVFILMAIIHRLNTAIEFYYVPIISFLHYLLLFMLVSKISSVFIKLSLVSFKNKACPSTELEVNSIEYLSKSKDKDKVTSISGAGELIGYLERILIFISLILKAPYIFAVVIGAKTLARFKKIYEEQNFSEIYLIGTLLSILFAIIIFYLGEFLIETKLY